MNNVVDLFQAAKVGFQYLLDDDGAVYAVTHTEWPYRIHRNGDDMAIVCKDTNEPFGILQRDMFNTLLACWLKVDDPKLLDDMANGK